jgi:hypothetical protein
VKALASRLAPANGVAMKLLLLLALAGCASEAAAQRRHDREVIFRGACDASGAVPLSEGRFVVADDEDNILRAYDADRGGEPLTRTDISAALQLPLKGKQQRAPELDLEAATRIGDTAYWLTSHGRNKKGKVKPERLHLFATTTLDAAGRIELVGAPYEDLVDDLIAAPQLARFGLAEAAARAPKDGGGLNLEGLTAAPDGTVLLAFRNPVPSGRALVVPLLNLPDLVDPARGGPARFGAPILLDLGGRGVRSLSWWRGDYLLIAGHHASGGRSALYRWDGRGPAHALLDLDGYNPEGFHTPEDRDQILVLSDDGERTIDGRACKKLKDPGRKQFRGVWLVLP